MPHFTKEELIAFSEYSDANNPARSGSVVYSVKKYIESVESNKPTCYFKGWLKQAIGAPGALKLVDTPLRELPLLLHKGAPLFVKWRLQIGK